VEEVQDFSACLSQQVDKNMAQQRSKTPQNPPPEQSRQSGIESVMRPRPQAEKESQRGSGQPAEVAPGYVFLASDAAAYLTGQVLPPNGGEIINS
jgi:NAD(P)-dependent dehydrogenase (short-subunit alcohol dehydrogenase family)